MTSYYISYADKPFLEAQKQALVDAKEYMSKKQWQALVAFSKNPDTKPVMIRQAMGLFMGIAGAPATAVIRELMPVCDETGDYGYEE